MGCRALVKQVPGRRFLRCVHCLCSEHSRCSVHDEKQWCVPRGTWQRSKNVMSLNVSARSPLVLKLDGACFAARRMSHSFRALSNRSEAHEFWTQIEQCSCDDAEGGASSTLLASSPDCAKGSGSMVDRSLLSMILSAAGPEPAYRFVCLCLGSTLLFCSFLFLSFPYLLSFFTFFLPFSIYVYTSNDLHISLSLGIWTKRYICTYLYIYIYIQLCHTLPIYLPICLSICPPICLYPSKWEFFTQFQNLPISIHVYLYLSIQQVYIRLHLPEHTT